jgi:hypothetical protein
LNNTARAREIATPQMTANNAPSPYVAAASSIAAAGNDAWRAFDRINANIWSTPNGTTTGWLSMDFGGSIVIDGYTIKGSGTQANNPRNWTLEGSNDNSTWTVLHTVTSATAIPANGTYSIASIGNSTGYRYYRVNISLNGTGTALASAELELYQQFTAAIAAGGSFNFNSGSISGSVTSASPLGIGATNLITVTATTGSVGLTLGGAVAANISNTWVMFNHSGNCNFNLSGTSFSAGNAGTGLINLISKSSPGTITISGSILTTTNVGNGMNILSSTNGNTVINGNIVPNQGNGITQTAGNLTINGNVTGGSGASGTGLVFTGTSITINGNVLGGSGTNSLAVSTTAPITVVGNVSGSTSAGISTSGPVIVSGSVAASSQPAISSTSAIFINVSGSVQASATAVGISSTNASAVVNLAGNLVNVNGKQAIYCQNLFLDNTATTQARFFTFGGQDRTLYSVDTFPNLPSSSNVRFGTTYGPGSGNTGTLRMASPQDVRSGVLTDNTTGSAILSMESLSNEIQTSTDPFAQRLRNISTVDTVGYLLTAFKK